MINTVEKKYNLLNTSLFNFKVTKQDGTILWVPNNTANTDYQEILLKFLSFPKVYLLLLGNDN